MHALVPILGMLLIASIMLQAGSETSAEGIVTALRQRSLMTRAIVLNIVIVPLLALVFCRLLRVEDGVTTGILLMAMSAGVPFLPLAGGRAKGGHLRFAVGLVFVFALICVVTAPVTAKLLLPAGYAAQLPLLRFLTTLVLFQLLPLVIGLLVRRSSVRIAETVAKVTGIAAGVFLIAIIVLVTAKLGPSFAALFGTRGMLAIVLLVAVSMILGWLAGGPDRGNRVTLAIGTGLRNPGLAMLIASSSFPGSNVVAAVVVFLIIQILLSVAVGVVFKRSYKALLAAEASTA